MPHSPSADWIFRITSASDYRSDVVITQLPWRWCNLHSNLCLIAKSEADPSRAGCQAQSTDEASVAETVIFLVSSYLMNIIQIFPVLCWSRLQTQRICVCRVGHHWDKLTVLPVYTYISLHAFPPVQVWRFSPIYPVHLLQLFVCVWYQTTDMPQIDLRYAQRKAAWTCGGPMFLPAAWNKEMLLRYWFQMENHK